MPDEVVFGPPDATREREGWVTWHPEWERKGKWLEAIIGSGTSHPTTDGCPLCDEPKPTAGSWVDVEVVDV